MSGFYWGWNCSFNYSVTIHPCYPLNHHHDGSWGFISFSAAIFSQALLFSQESSCVGTVVRILALSRFLRRCPSTCSFNFCFQSHLNQARSSFCRPISSVQGQNVNHRDRRSDWIEFKILRLFNFFFLLFSWMRDLLETLTLLMWVHILAQLSNYSCCLIPEARSW